MARFFLMETGNFAVWGSDMGSEPDPVNWQRIARYNETLHPAIHQRLSDNVKNAVWSNGQLVINGQVVLDSAWIQARQAELDTAASNKATDANERAAMLAQVSDVITQLESDRANWNTLTTILLLRPVLFRMLTAIIQILKVQRAMLRDAAE